MASVMFSWLSLLGWVGTGGCCAATNFFLGRCEQDEILAQRARASVGWGLSWHEASYTYLGVFRVPTFEVQTYQVTARIYVITLCMSSLPNTHHVVKKGIYSELKNAGRIRLHPGHIAAQYRYKTGNGTVKCSPPKLRPIEMPGEYAAS